MTLRSKLLVAAAKEQGDFKRVLCVCTSGILRSPTAAQLLCQSPYNFNTRCAGLDSEKCLIPVTDLLVFWADEIVCMTPEHEAQLRSEFEILVEIKCLNIDDEYNYREPELMKLILDRYDQF
jgi:predicted protein tyrosine phosphatase